MSQNKKIVALLVLSPGGIDVNLRDCFEYYFSVTNKFSRFPIYNTEDNNEKTLELLNKYYNEGYRIFIGFNRSNTLEYVLPWFLQHPDVLGISTSTANTPTLSVPKNVYRIAPLDNFIIDSLNNVLTGAISNGGRIFYLYSDGNLSSVGILDYMKTLYGAENLVTYPFDTSYSNLSKELIQEFYSSNNVTDKDVCVVYVFSKPKREEYLSYFDTNYSIPVDQYQLVIGTGKPYIDLNNTSLIDKCKAIVSENITESSLLNEGSLYLQDRYVASSLNFLYLSTSLSTSTNLNLIYSYNLLMWFDSNKDLLYSSVKYLNLTDVGFAPYLIKTKDPIYGLLTFNKVV